MYADSNVYMAYIAVKYYSKVIFISITEVTYCIVPRFVVCEGGVFFTQHVLDKFL